MMKKVWWYLILSGFVLAGTVQRVETVQGITINNNTPRMIHGFITHPKLCGKTSKSMKLKDKVKSIEKAINNSIQLKELRKRPIFKQSTDVQVIFKSIQMKLLPSKDTPSYIPLGIIDELVHLKGEEIEKLRAEWKQYKAPLKEKLSFLKAKLRELGEMKEAWGRASGKEHDAARNKLTDEFVYYKPSNVCASSWIDRSGHDRKGSKYLTPKPDHPLGGLESYNYTVVISAPDKRDAPVFSQQFVRPGSTVTFPSDKMKRRFKLGKWRSINMDNWL